MYEGDIFEGKKHGYGIFTYKNGTKYEGKFIDDMKDGKGKLIYKNGDVF